MKKIVCAIICACLLVSGALAEISLSGYTDAQLLELLTQVQQEIADRRIEASASLRGGDYIVGEDIPAGKYVFRCTYRGDWWANFSVYAERGSGKQKKWDIITKEDGEYECLLTLEAGDKLSCDEPFTLSVYAGVMFK